MPCHIFLVHCKESTWQSRCQQVRLLPSEGLFGVDQQPSLSCDWSIEISHYKALRNRHCQFDLMWPENLLKYMEGNQLVRCCESRMILLSGRKYSAKIMFHNFSQLICTCNDIRIWQLFLVKFDQIWSRDNYNDYLVIIKVILYELSFLVSQYIKRKSCTLLSTLLIRL